MNEIDPQDFEQVDGWIVQANADKTDGKGAFVIEAVCQLEATARRLARGAGVQGCDATVHQCKLLVPQSGIHHTLGPVDLVEPTPADKFEQQQIDLVHRTMERAKKLGISDAELEILRRR